MDPKLWWNLWTTMIGNNYLHQRPFLMIKQKLLWLWKEEQWLPKDVHFIIIGTWQYITLCGNKELADVVKGMDLEMEVYLGLSSWVQCNHKGPYKEKNQRRKDWMGHCYLWRWSRVKSWGLWIVSRSCHRKDKKTELSLGTRKEPSFANSFILAQWDTHQMSNTQNVR